MKKLICLIFILIPLSLFSNEVIIEKADAFKAYEIKYTISCEEQTIVRITCEEYLLYQQVYNRDSISLNRAIIHIPPQCHNSQISLSYISDSIPYIHIKSIEDFVYSEYDVERYDDAPIENITVVGGDTPVMIFFGNENYRYYILTSKDLKKWDIMFYTDGNDNRVFYYIHNEDTQMFYKLKQVKTKYLNIESKTQ